MPLYHFWPLQWLTMSWFCLSHSNLNGERYLQMINEEIVPHLHEHSELQQRGAFRRLWWKQDCAPAQRRIIVGERLRELFNHRVIALNYDPEWLPRPPDSTPCDFFLWWCLKSKVFKTPPRDCLRHRQDTWTI